MALVKKPFNMTDTNLTLADIWRRLREAGMSDAEQLPLRRRLLSLQIRTAAVDRQRLLIVERVLPLRAAGGWLPELAELVGADLVISRKGAPPAAMTLADISAAKPDVILLACTGATLAENIGFADGLNEAGVPLFAANAVDFFQAPDASIVGSAEILAELLHQDARLDFGHKGSHWQKIAPLNPRYPQG